MPGFTWKYAMVDMKSPQKNSNYTHLRTLADIKPGEVAIIRSFLPAMPSTRKSQLLAYGMLPGLKVIVVQHSPVTIIRIEQTELAIEAEIAQAIEVQ
jgi:Fe2+ transport system protein FeoA